MGVYSNLQPEKVFYYFEELTKIPHGSYNVDRISDYIADFGRSHNLETIQDEYKNVIIIKEASAGYENEPPIILQGHMDMVAVHKPDFNIDMTTEGLKAAINLEEDYIYAEGTSLGGDDGIAVAYALAILEDDTLSHPRLEVVITTNEEVGMDGARGIDLSMLKGNRLLNLDSEEEGYFLTGCAGGLRANYFLTLLSENIVSGTLYEIEIGGLLGGHSGEEIIKGRANSNKLAARLLYEIKIKLDSNLAADNNPLYITHLNGGLADNAIPRETHIGLVVFNTSEKYEVLTDEVISRFAKAVAIEYQTKDPGIYCRIISKEKVSDISAYEATDAVRFLNAAPDGVQAMSSDVPGLVETSLNLGIVEFPICNKPADLDAYEAKYGTRGSARLHAAFCVRSSIESSKYALVDSIMSIADLVDASYNIVGDYPGWQYRTDSPLREKMIALYEKMYGKKPIVQAIHAGLECGILGNKINDLDCVSIGPDMQNIHTTEERLYISSTRRVYEYIVALLATKD
ncbi:MAG: aminoacyl-histidine dipeptidase [Lachnospiraceae bacterium]|nr:aminoacyl-histidine dipeptidase [Lachnospiraceae bacterium]